MENNRFPLLAMSFVIAVSFLINKLFPDLPYYFYLVLASISGIPILYLNRRRIAKYNLIVTDERIEKNYRKASYLSYRLTYSISLVTGILLRVIPGLNDELKIMGLVLILVSNFQVISFLISYQVFKMKS